MTATSTKRHRRTLAQAIALSGYSRTRLQEIFSDADEHPCACSLATFRRVLREHFARPHGNCELVSIDGESLTLEAWAKRAQVSVAIVYRRARRYGWTREQTICASLARPGVWPRGRVPAQRRAA